LEAVFIICLASLIFQFGGIDVLVNNAASFYAGYFEELAPAQFDRQLAVRPRSPVLPNKKSAPSASSAVN
jgi:NAD(P)-dependent dehydrogenase (short-subunit alcohol dehydrogenase family)